MIQFTIQEQKKIRRRVHDRPEILEKLRKEVSEIYEGPLQVPKEGIANWGLYYYCPRCSVSLTFHSKDPYHHVCPQCHSVYTGEPYDSTWWGIVNGNNSSAAYKMGILYMITGEVAYARKTIEILSEYARYFEGYQVHGDIPYNGPGKSCAQTLDEANFQRTLAMAYDLTLDQMTPQERTQIRDHLFIPAAEFLRGHRKNQMHNHEVIINSAIAVIGLLFEREDLIRFAVYEPYGLLYQLEAGMQQNHIWFEGSFGYHFYALVSFFAYEKFALHTPHSHIHHPNYRFMMEVLLHYLDPEDRIPMLNDTTYGHSLQTLSLYEFAYREIGGPIIGEILSRIYRHGEKRNSLETCLYGVDVLPQPTLSPAAALPSCQNAAGASFRHHPIPNDALPEPYHTPAGTHGYTVLRGKEERYLLFKHDTYGGEHDHYDRLSISFEAFGRPVSMDLGTTGYGAALHYDYYKNTAVHNTVNINGENQMPASCRLERFEKKGDFIYVEAVCDWTQPYRMPDSFTIPQWNEEVYKKVKMKRKILWGTDYFAEAFEVTGAPEGSTVDWVLHMTGTRVPTGNSEEPLRGPFSGKKPYKHLHDMINCGSTCLKQTFSDGKIYTDIYSYLPDGCQYAGMGPDNPSYRDINFLIERRTVHNHTDLVYRHVIETAEKRKIKSVVFETDAIHILQEDGETLVLLL